ncbi:hypothetical protein Micbo1qcDRAFT_160756 [Microdochium bolleyi]|uniref:DUF6590 domain-containing protein n=1 Tax=Microdochium bolleyi TaxID=196109 RepID=A0A136J6V4_9PEZI|nr:hypothetical protein Micbo1qcDRAFT_160756 [Microdochium bolleyi]
MYSAYPITEDFGEVDGEDEVKSQNLRAAMERERTGYDPDNAPGLTQSQDDALPGHQQKKHHSKTVTRQQPKSTRWENPFEPFTLQRSKHFCVGRVFKAMWIQTRGSSSSLSPMSEDDLRSESIRRFVVVTTQRGYSNCVAILTYQGFGCLKRGTRPENHCMAYDERYEPPQLLAGEPELGFAPIPITIGPELAQIETVDPTSRINLAKIYTVEHNIPVQFIGYIPPEGLDYLVESVSTLWARDFTPHHRKGYGEGKRQ